MFDHPIHGADTARNGTLIWRNDKTCRASRVLNGLKCLSRQLSHGLFLDKVADESVVTARECLNTVILIGRRSKSRYSIAVLIIN